MSVLLKDLEWYVALDGVRHGPFPHPEVVNAVRDGRLRSDCLVWREDMEDWRPLRSLAEFAELVTPPPLPPPPLPPPLPPASPPPLPAAVSPPPLPGPVVASPVMPAEYAPPAAQPTVAAPPRPTPAPRAATTSRQPAIGLTPLRAAIIFGTAAAIIIGSFIAFRPAGSRVSVAPAAKTPASKP